MFPNLTAELKKRNMTVRAFAEALGISEKSARARLNGDTEFRLREIEIISRLFPEANLEQLFQNTVSA